MSSREVAKPRPHPARYLPAGFSHDSLAGPAATSLCGPSVPPWLLVCSVKGPASVWLISTVKFQIPLLRHRHSCPDCLRSLHYLDTLSPRAYGDPGLRSGHKEEGEAAVQSHRARLFSPESPYCISLPVGSFKLFFCASIITALPGPEKLLSWKTLEPASKSTD